MATIMLTLDGSTFAEQAIPHALGRLKAGDELLLLHIVEPAPSLRTPEAIFVDVDVTDCQEYLKRIASRLANRNVKVRTELRVGSAREEILASAARESAALIVVASHGRRGLTRWLLGSVAESVARKAPCPVWMVRCRSQPEFTLHQPWEEAPPAVARVLVPLDTAEHSSEAVDYVRANLDRAAVTLQLLSATNIAWMGQTDVCGETLGVVRALLEEKAEDLRRDGWRVEVSMDPGAPAEAILDTADEWGADLIVMASHTRTGPQRWFLGSVTENVVRHAKCPVAVIRVAPAATPTPV